MLSASKFAIAIWNIQRGSDVRSGTSRYTAVLSTYDALNEVWNKSNEDSFKDEQIY